MAAERLKTGRRRVGRGAELFRTEVAQVFETFGPSAKKD
jgi:hypothetical protein